MVDYGGLGGSSSWNTNTAAAVEGGGVRGAYRGVSSVSHTLHFCLFVCISWAHGVVVFIDPVLVWCWKDADVVVTALLSA